jgi:ankyrin repeat protein
VEFQSSAVALALLRHGANPNAYLNANRPEWRRSVLQHAAVTGQTAVVVALLESGADLGVNGPKALNGALWRGHTDIAAALIASGLDVNATFVDPNKPVELQTGEVALQTAAQSGNVASVELLLLHGAKVDATNHRGQTAIQYAVIGGHMPVVEILLANGAAVSAENLSSAMGAKDSVMANALMEHLKIEGISLVDIESLIADADRAGEDEIITTLFALRASLRSEESPSLFLFARSDIENCVLVLWHPNEKTEIIPSVFDR